MHITHPIQPQSRPAPGEDAGSDDPVATGCCAVVCGASGIETVCDLLRAGAASVTLLRAGERPEADSADLLIAQPVAGIEAATAAVRHARRALRPGGVARLKIPRGDAGSVLRATRGALRAAGLTLRDVATDRDGIVLTATRPAERPA